MLDRENVSHPHPKYLIYQQARLSAHDPFIPWIYLYLSFLSLFVQCVCVCCLRLGISFNISTMMRLVRGKIVENHLINNSIFGPISAFSY